jgi:hypothetical protein
MTLIGRIKLSSAEDIASRQLMLSFDVSSYVAKLADSEHFHALAPTYGPHN